MTIVKWRLLVLLDKHKKVTLAARELGIKQPTATFHMKKMEEEWGTELFESKTGRILLTDAGKALLRFAREIIRLHEEARQEMRLLASAGGRLNVRIDAPCREQAAALAAAALEPFGRGIDFTAERRQEEPDLIVSERAEPPSVAGSIYWQAELKLAVSASHPSYADASAESLLGSQAPWIAPPVGSELRRLCLEWSGARGSALREAYTSADLGTARTLAAQGLGFAIVPDFSRHHPAAAAAGAAGLRLLPLPGAPSYGLELHPGPQLARKDEPALLSLFADVKKPPASHGKQAADEDQA
ncbi:LysR family transcriptional regulator [Paenibacillus albicereus]|uniref:LysR family transcriptional regulator n=1 Tax=Paenibacillus albicereus TaxID=2726185 RepID=A0A6H2GVL2_9BACL|nr:LysR family transcriptional regulator [Paenibacillus albicereus]QJC51463.1 LysR family transcriptional regulator [Paenibacillus albicereus]